VAFKDIADRDTEQKFRQKEYADSARRAKPTTLAPGDRVLIQAPRKNKLSPRFDPDPFVVVGSPSPSEVTLRRGKSELRRSISAVQPIQTPTIAAGDAAQSSGEEAGASALVDVASSPTEREDSSPPGDASASSPAAPNIVRSRSGREVRPPVRLDL